jgi:hypothetical protein
VVFKESERDTLKGQSDIRSCIIIIYSSCSSYSQILYEKNKKNYTLFFSSILSSSSSFCSPHASSEHTSVQVSISSRASRNKRDNYLLIHFFFLDFSMLAYIYIFVCYGKHRVLEREKTITKPKSSSLPFLNKVSVHKNQRTFLCVCVCVYSFFTNISYVLYAHFTYYGINL